MNKYVVFSVIGLAVILSAGTALAYQGDGIRSMTNKEVRQEHKGAMDEIFANNDFSTWQTLMEEKVENSRVRANDLVEKITEENFSKMAEAHTLMQAGDYEGAKALHEELGLGGSKKGFGGHRMGGQGERGLDCPYAK